MAKRNNRDGGLVYSTEQGRMCPSCNQSATKCVCKAKKTGCKGDGIIRVCYEIKGRKGKGVTLVTGLSIDGDNLKKTAKKLKQICGSGGTIKQGTIEIQGDHRDEIIVWLTANDHAVKRVGG